MAHSHFLDSLEPLLFEWASRKAKLDKEFNRKIRKWADRIEKLPERWRNLARAQYAFGKIFGSPTTVRKFHRSVRKELTQEGQLIFESYIDNIWWYSLFTVEQKLDDDFFLIYDYSTDQEYILNSKAVSVLTREGKRLFLTLLYENPRCCQTFGIVNAFKGFHPFDFFFFASMLNPEAFKKGGLASVIFLNPVRFYLLCLYTEIPVVAHGDEIVVQCSSRVRVQDFSEAKLGSTCSGEESEGVVRWRLLGGDDMFRFADLYWDREQGLVTLHCSGRERYTEAVNKLESALSLPSEPQHEASLLMMTATREILGMDLPGVEYSSLFEEEPSVEKQAQLDKMNALLGEFAHAHNYGSSYDIEELSTKLGIPLDIAKEMENSYQQKRNGLIFPAKGGIENYKPPPPVVRMKMKGRFPKNELFDLVVEESTRRLFMSYKSRLGIIFDKNRMHSLKELPELLEFAYADVMDTEDQLELLYTLYMLRERGDEFQSVRAYAAELLRTFGQVLLEDDSDESVAEYTDFYGAFCARILYPFGLVDVDGQIRDKDLRHPNFCIKASDFFHGWIRWK